MTRKGAAQRKRLRDGLEPVKPGKPGWVHGSKLVFFKAHVEDYLAAAELKKTGPFYKKIAYLYLKKYGYNTPWEGDLDEGQEVADDVDEDEDTDSLPKEEADARAEYFQKLQSRIGVWYNTKHGGSVEKATQRTPFQSVFNKPQLAPPIPSKPRIEHYYSHRFYEERVKDRVTARWEAVSRLPNPPKLITIRNAVTKECWEGESEEFKAEVRAALEREHEAAKEAHARAVSADAPSNAEEYNIALNNAAYYLQPFADAARERFGMNVSILLCGPIADRGGRIEMRSIHSGTTRGLVPRVWSDYDRAGFDAAQRSFVNFTHECFSEEECRARSLGNISVPRENDEGEQSEPPARGITPEGPSAGGASSAVFGEGGAPATAPHGTASTGPPASSPANTTPGAVNSTQPPPIGTTPTATGEPAILPISQVPSATISPATTTPTPPITTSAMPPADPLLNWMNNHPFGEDGVNGEGIFEGMPQGGFDFSGMVPSDFVLGDLEIGRALTAELKQLPAEDYEAQMSSLRAMSAADLMKANEMARDRLFFARIQRGVPAKVAFDMSSDPEDDGGAPAKSTSGGAPGRTRATTSNEGEPGSGGATLEERDESRGGATPGSRGSDESGGGATPESRELEQSGEGSGRRTAPTPSPHEPSWWDIQETGSWAPELVSAFKGFARGKTWGGQKWEECVKMLVEFERLNGFQDKGGLKAPCTEERPSEVADFMQRRRVWAAPFAIKTDVGGKEVEGSFASRWWQWWGTGQPPARLRAEGWLKAREVMEEDWEEMAQRFGRNGLLLYVGGLLWWGEAAAGKEERERSVLLAEWGVAVDEVCDVLGEVVRIVGASRRASNEPEGESSGTGVQKTRANGKRKTRDASFESEKENKRPK